MPRKPVEKSKTKRDDGVYYIRKSQDGRLTSYMINGYHRWVKTYLGMKNLFVNHIDEKPSNNKLDNLRLFMFLHKD